MSKKYEEIYQIDGPRQGPTVTILAGVHGNELPGILAVEKIAPTLRIKRGRLFILYGNPKAIIASRRQTEQNLNRMFCSNLTKEVQCSYEYQRAKFIRKYLDKSDICLDLHASTSEKTEAFGITEQKGLELIKNLSVERVVMNIDEYHPGSTDGYMNNRGKIGICIECGNQDDTSASVIAEYSILRLLSDIQMLDIPAIKSDASKTMIYKVFGQYISKTEDFTLQKEYADFEPIEISQIVGVDDKNSIKFDEDFNILFARNSKQAGEECFLQIKKVDSI